MRISKISTGKRLEKPKTFGELEEGDIFYWVIPTDKSIDDITYKVVHKYNQSANTVFGYSELNPDKMQGVKRDISIDCCININPDKHVGTLRNVSLPSNSSYFVMNSIFWATSLDLVYEIIKKYSIYSHLK